MQGRLRASSALGIAVLALLLVGSVQPLRVPPPPLHPECPQWLLDYIQWHAANKFSPDAKYLLFDCAEGSCSGLADRLRGLLWLLRVAAYTKRVFLVRMNVPIPLQTIFEPTHINWTVPAVGLHNGQVVRLEPPLSMGDLGMPAKNDAERTVFHSRTETWIAGKTNELENEFWPPEPRLYMFTRDASCMFQAMLMPSQAVEEVVAKHYTEMQVDPSKPYIAVHLRAWQMIGEEEKKNHTLESEERILTSIMCARDMAPRCNVNLDENPAVLITDGLHLRRRVSLRLYHQLTTTAITPHHFDASVNSRLVQRHLETIADFVILARAKGLFVDGESGFSRLASYLGGNVNFGANPCLQVNSACKRFLPRLDYRTPSTSPKRTT